MESLEEEEGPLGGCHQVVGDLELAVKRRLILELAGIIVEQVLVLVECVRVFSAGLLDLGQRQLGLGRLGGVGPGIDKGLVGIGGFVVAALRVGFVGKGKLFFRGVALGMPVPPDSPFDPGFLVMGLVLPGLHIGGRGRHGVVTGLGRRRQQEAHRKQKQLNGESHMWGHTLGGVSERIKRDVR